MADPFKASPPGPPDTVGVGELASALGANRHAVLRAIVRGELPAADRRTLGGHRRWSLASALAIVEKAGLTCPSSWRTAAASTAGGDPR